jgi:hypothetical protein
VTGHELLESIKNKDVHLEVSSELLIVDAPAGVITDPLRAALVEHKPKLIKLLKWERRKLEEADRRGLVIRWSEYLTWSLGGAAWFVLSSLAAAHFFGKLL